GDRLQVSTVDDTGVRVVPGAQRVVLDLDDDEASPPVLRAPRVVLGVGGRDLLADQSLALGPRAVDEPVLHRTPTRTRTSHATRMATQIGRPAMLSTPTKDPRALAMRVVFMSASLRGQRPPVGRRCSRPGRPEDAHASFTIASKSDSEVQS